MMKHTPDWGRSSDPVIKSPARYSSGPAVKYMEETCDQHMTSFKRKI